MLTTSVVKKGVNVFFNDVNNKLINSLINLGESWTVGQEESSGRLQRSWRPGGGYGQVRQIDRQSLGDETDFFINRCIRHRQLK